MNLNNNYRITIKLKKGAKDGLTPGDSEKIKRELQKILTEEAGITECSFKFTKGIISIKCRVKAINEERGRRKALSLLTEMYETIPESLDFIIEVSPLEEITAIDHL